LISPTVWQTEISPNGKYIATLQVSRMTIYSSNIIIHSCITVHPLLQKQPQSRRLVWIEDNNILILSSIEAKVFIYTSRGDLLHITELVHSTILKTIGRPIELYVGNSNKNSYLIHVVSEKAVVTTNQFRFDEGWKQLEINQYGLQSEYKYKGNSGAMVVETCKWLHQYQYIVMILRNNKNPSLHHGILNIVSFTTSLEWINIQEVELLRSDPYYTPSTTRSFSLTSDWMMNTLWNGKSKLLPQPIIKIISSPDER
jgi:hypothetical protein